MPVTMSAAGLRIVPVILCCLCGAAAPDAYARSGRDAKPTLPRFASLKQPKTNVRVGPGTQYPIRWIYQRQGLPIEVIAEFGNWRRIRGSDSSDGWVHTALLSARRTALAAPWNPVSVNLRVRPSDRAAVVARLQPRVLVRVKRCDHTWCAVDVPRHDLDGYVRQVKLWGVYPDETIGSGRSQLFRPVASAE
jgi:SH3-like domain-containing protein